jgi:hypothetical protein
MVKRKIVVRGIVAAFIMSLGAIYLINEMVLRAEALTKEHMWSERMQRELPVGLSEKEAEAVLQAWGLKYYWIESYKQFIARPDGRIRYFNEDYTIKLILQFDSSGHLAGTEVQRTYAAML